MNSSSLIIPLMLAAMAVFMFLNIRNQKKRAAAMTQMQDSLVPGSRVQLHSGLFGTVVSVTDEEIVELEIAPGVVTEWNRLAVREVVSPVEADPAADASTEVPDSPAALEGIDLDKKPGDDERDEK